MTRLDKEVLIGPLLGAIACLISAAIWNSAVQAGDMSATPWRDANAATGVFFLIFLALGWFFSCSSFGSSKTMSDPVSSGDFDEEVHLDKWGFTWVNPVKGHPTAKYIRADVVERRMRRMERALQRIEKNAMRWAKWGTQQEARDALRGASEGARERDTNLNQEKQQ